MFRRTTRMDRELREVQLAGQAVLAMHTELPLPDFPGPMAGATPVAPEPEVVPDFLPPDFRAPSRQDVSGFMMRWDRPLVIDGEVHQCHCGAYRNWIVFNMRDDSVWLRCTAGHETKESRLDTTWYNRNSGPVDHFHPSLDEGLRHLGH
ncbi:hypothetical protein ACFYN0_01020 [Streptomyces sp. NPDC006704]|uniref:hypothetical protein n=1 Tax=Streptomyces sp. NPDC006704 TaxID=3364760 RepID=UPI00369EEF50